MDLLTNPDAVDLMILSAGMELHNAGCPVTATGIVTLVNRDHELAVATIVRARLEAAGAFDRPRKEQHA